MNIGLVGSSCLKLSLPILHEIDAVLGSLLAGDRIYIRSSDGRKPSSDFETLVARRVEREPLIRLVLCSPDEKNRAANFKRDYELVENCDEVLVYFPAGEDLSLGAWHVVHAAMQKGVPCRAYEIEQTGRKWLLGSEDGPEVTWDVD